MAIDQGRINLLLVDDDFIAIDRLRSQLGSTTVGWTIRFARSAAEALQELQDGGPCDVIVTDLRMPLVDGADLLAAVKARSPETVRVVASDFLDLPSALRSLPVAQRFVTQPLQLDQLHQIVQDCRSLHSRLTDPRLRALVGGLDVLPSPSGGVLELNAALNRPDAKVDEVAAIVERDPAMTAKLLQLVNSAFFGLNRRVTNVQHAVTYLGLATVRNLLTAVELVRAFQPADPRLGHIVEEIQAHSLAVAETARTLMTHRHQVHDAFAAGMMHDVGLLALIACAPERFIEVRDEAVRNGLPLTACEERVLGVSHAALGGYVLDLWGLPYSLVEAVSRSHDADRIPERQVTPTHAVFVAEQLVNVSGKAAFEGGRLPDPEYLAALGFSSFVTQMVGRTHVER